MREGIGLYDPRATERAQRMQENHARLHSNGDDRPLVDIDPETARRNFMVMLGRGQILNPDTSKPYTPDELGNIFGRNPRVVARALRRSGIYKQPLPKVRIGPLPENEKTFFKGLAFSDLDIDKVVWSGHPLVTVATEARIQQKHAIIRAVFESWGEVHTTKGNHPKTTAFLDSPTFDFMIEQQSPGSTILLSKSKFPPFLLGLMVGKMRGQEHRISLRKGDLLKSVHDNFCRQFGFPLGNYHVEPRPGGKLVTSHRCKRSGEGDCYFG